MILDTDHFNILKMATRRRAFAAEIGLDRRSRVRWLALK
jgi:hypothetical protein